MAAQPDVMTPDGRREAATQMIENLWAVRARGIMAAWEEVNAPAAQLQYWRVKVNDAKEEYNRLLEEILELMGVDS